jgi:hypothetical protein
MNTLSSSWKPTDTYTERCDSCGLWYEGLHPARDGRYLCRLCLEVEGLNRSEWGGSVEHSAHVGRVLRVEGRPVRR